MGSLYSNRKKIPISLIGILVVLTIGTLTYQFAFATPSYQILQTPTKNYLEKNQERIDLKRTDQANIKDPTLRAGYEPKLKFLEKQATEQAVAATEVPTLASIRHTAVAKMTATAKANPNPKKGPGQEHTREPGLKPGYSNIYLARDVKMNGAWFENEPNGPAVIYIAGVIRGTKRGIILRYNEATNHKDRYRLSVDTGVLEIIDKKGNSLVLKTESGNSLFFDIVSNQFSDPDGKVIPIEIEAEITPTVNSPYPAPS